jgi:hypothetical protein
LPGGREIGMMAVTVDHMAHVARRVSWSRSLAWRWRPGERDNGRGKLGVPRRMC